MSIYLLLQAISTVLNGEIQKGIWGQYFRYQGIVTFISYIGLMYLVFNRKVIKISLSDILTTVALSGSIVAVCTIVQAILYYAGVPVYSFYGRMTALFGNPNFAASYLVVGFPAVVYWLKKQSYQRASFISSWLLFLIAIFLTMSRGGIVIFAGLTVVLVSSPRLRLILGSVLVVILCILVPILGRDRMSSFDSRTTIWTYGVQAVLDRPLFGWGVENFETAFSQQLQATDFDLQAIRVDKAHNEMIEIAVASGLVGLSVWLLLVGTTLRILWKHRSDKQIYIFGMMFVSFLLVSSVNVVSIALYLFFYIAVGEAARLDEADRTS